MAKTRGPSARGLPALAAIFLPAARRRAKVPLGKLFIPAPSRAQEKGRLDGASSAALSFPPAEVGCGSERAGQWLSVEAAAPLPKTLFPQDRHARGLSPNSCEGFDKWEYQ